MMIPIKKLTPKRLKKIAGRIKNAPLVSRALGKLSLLGSQAGQDFWIYGEAFNQKRRGYFLDLGAHDGINISNTYLLETKYKWSGLCVEANPKTFEKLVLNRKVECVCHCIDKDDGEVDFAPRNGRGGIIADDLDNNPNSESLDTSLRLNTISLKSLLEKYNAPKEIDYLSIDVEGAEERILGEFDFDTYLFRTITIERPSNRLRSILENNGYILVKEIPNFDCFYIHQSFKKEYKKNLFEFYANKKIRVSWK